MRIKSGQKGFTIVELLIVIVIIGILAAIVIVAYNGITARANDSSVQSDLANIGKKFEIYKVENGQYPMGSAQLGSIDGLNVSIDAYGQGLNVSGVYYNLVYCWPTTANPDVFALVAQSKSGNVFESKNGAVRQVSYSFTGGSGGICNNAGAPLENGTARDWFKSAGNWSASYIDNI